MLRLGDVRVEYIRYLTSDARSRISKVSKSLFFAGGFGMMMVNKRISVCICISVLLSAVVTIIIGTKICAGG